MKIGGEKTVWVVRYANKFVIGVDSELVNTAMLTLEKFLGERGLTLQSSVAKLQIIP